MRLTNVALAGLPRAGLSGGRRLPSVDQYELLYLAESRFVALCEFRALIGLPLAGLVVPFPRGAFRTKAFQTILNGVVDLSDVNAAQHPLRTGAQELTGDWQGNHVRAVGLPAAISVRAPTEIAATQELGLALHQAPGIEGFLSLSSVVPTRRILVVFPGKLMTGSAIRYRFGGQEFVLDDTGTRLMP